MTPQTFAREVANEGLKATPPVAVAGASLLGLGLQDWVYITAIVYTVLQIGVLIVRGITWAKRRKLAVKPPITIPANTQPPK